MATELTQLEYDQQVDRLLNRSPQGQLLAHAARYANLDLERVGEVYCLDQVDISVSTFEEEEDLSEKDAQFSLDDEYGQVAADESEAAEESVIMAKANIKTKSKTPTGKTGRGVTHVRPGKVLFGAVVYLLTWILMLATVIGVPIWIFYYKDVVSPVWMLVLIGALVVSLLVSIMAVPKARCTVCMQPMMVNLSCLRNKKASRFMFGNTALSAAVLSIFQRKLRCPYCGTRQHLHGRDH